MEAPGSFSWRVAFGAALVVAVTVPAHANGRFPRAQRLMEEPGAPAHLAVYGTYGLLLTSDGGQTWNHVCEAATGPFAGEAPLLELLPHGRIVLSSETGLRGSAWPACEWRGLLQPALPDSVQDVTRTPTSENELLALLNQPDASVGLR